MSWLKEVALYHLALKVGDTSGGSKCKVMVITNVCGLVCG